MVLKEVILNNFYVGGVVVLNQLIFTVSTLGGCGSLERTDLEQLILWEGVLVLKELTFNSFHFGTVWWYCKNCLITLDTL